MKENDKIKELFKERFESFEAPVDPKVWSGIESSLGNAAPATGVSVLSSKAIISLVVGATAVATIGAVSYMNSPSETPNRVEVVVPASTPETVSSKIITETDVKDNPIIIEEKDTESIVVLDNSEMTHNETSEEVDKTTYEKNNISVNETSSINENINEEEEAVATPVLVEKEFTPSTVNTEVVSQAPATIDIAEQSRAQAYPAGGVAPLNVAFSSVAEVEEIKWKFDDGTESSELNPEHEFETPGIYIVTMLAKLKDGTVVMDKAVVEVKENTVQEETVVESSSLGTIGNYFTPNGDGENDEFYVRVKGIQSYSISIYSVNGQLVYTSNDPDKSWNGNDLSGNRVVDGTYYYMINAIGEDQKVYSPKGYLTVTEGF